MRDDGLDDGDAGLPVGARTDWGGVGFDDAAGTLAFDDAHHDGARLGAGELGDGRHPETADPEGDRDDEPVVFLGRGGEYLESGERVGVEPAAVPGSRRLAMMSCGSQVPSTRATAGSVVPVGRSGMTGTSSGVSPPTASSRTQASTPSS